MGGFGGGGSQAAVNSESGGAAASGVAGGISTGGIASGIGIGLSAYNMMKDQKKNAKQLQQLRLQQMEKAQKRKNLLEERLAARRARIGNMGISSDGSTLAANKRLIDDTMNDIAEDDDAFNSEYDDISEKYQQQLKKNLLENGMSLSDKVLK